MFGGTFITTLGKSDTDKSRIRTFALQRKIHKLAPGVYLDSNTHRALTSHQQHSAHILANALSHSRSVIVGSSAATLQGLPLVEFPQRYPIELARSSTTRPTTTSAGRALHLRKLNPHHRQHITTITVPTVASIDSPRYEDLLAPGAPIAQRDIHLTSPLITALDLARWHSLDSSVMALDHALRNRLFTRDQLADCADLLKRTRGSQQVALATRLATPWSESPMESRTKVGMWRRNFPAPLQQVSFFTPDGTFIGRADFYFPSHALIVEYDGKGKYTGEFGIEREQAQLAEYLRQRNLHDGGIAIVRLTADANSIDIGLDRIARRLIQSDATGHLADLSFQAAGPAWQE